MSGKLGDTVRGLPRRTEVNGNPHLLAWINPEEAELLRQRGGGIAPGGGQMKGPGGLPAFDDGSGDGGDGGSGDGGDGGDGGAGDGGDAGGDAGDGGTGTGDGADGGDAGAGGDGADGGGGASSSGGADNGGGAGYDVQYPYPTGVKEPANTGPTAAEIAAEQLRQQQAAEAALNGRRTTAAQQARDAWGGIFNDSFWNDRNSEWWNNQAGAINQAEASGRQSAIAGLDQELMSTPLANILTGGISQQAQAARDGLGASLNSYNSATQKQIGDSLSAIIASIMGSADPETALAQGMGQRDQLFQQVRPVAGAASYSFAPVETQNNVATSGGMTPEEQAAYTRIRSSDLFGLSSDPGSIVIG
jgi:hypothetical protein